MIYTEPVESKSCPQLLLDLISRCMLCPISCGEDATEVDYVTMSTRPYNPERVGEDVEGMIRLWGADYETPPLCDRL